jgi:hypothetical protein
MILAYPSLLLDVIQGRTLQRKTCVPHVQRLHHAPRAGLPSGCYPLDPHYKNSANAEAIEAAEGNEKNA